ncbi:MAG: glycosyltransferase family 39 protein [Armatimonadota bacterium]|nr:glycosyltransferase family 39 protein [Armatimonadota bacterium]MDR7520705.1 glycosyltransferase family 39 protein [Armatimonadota bacterium]MDR7550185.1 glycosyltransferase family 39 protein [Armatimonadota bacterium]
MRWTGIGGDAQTSSVAWRAAGLVLFVLAVVLRVVALDAKALWFDETVSVLFASLPVARALLVIGANDPHPPLYYLLLHAWMGVFGDGETAVRSLSVFLGAPVVLLTWLFGRRLLGPAPALLAAALVALAPSQVAAAQEARMYGLLTLAAVGSWWALWAALGVPGARHAGTATSARRPWAVYAAATAVMLYSHYYGVLVVVSQVGYLIWWRPGAGVWRRALSAWCGVALAFLPWGPLFAQQLAGGRAWPAHRIPLSAATLPDTLAAMTVGRPVLEAWGPRLSTIQPIGTSWPAVLGMAAAAALAVAAVRTPSVSRRIVALLLAAALGPPVVAFAVSLELNVYAPRYLLFIVPAVALLVAAGAASLIAGPTRWLRAAGVILSVLVVMPNVTGTLAFHRQPRLDVFDWRLISRTLAAHARDDDAIVFLPGFSRIPVDYYFRGPHRRVVLTPDGADVVGPEGARLAGVVESLSRHPRVWILTVPPIPEALERLTRALDRRSYRVARREAVNMAVLILLERDHPP